LQEREHVVGLKYIPPEKDACCSGGHGSVNKRERFRI
jgi:hypothetical protein